MFIDLCILFIEHEAGIVYIRTLIVTIIIKFDIFAKIAYEKSYNISSYL